MDTLPDLLPLLHEASSTLQPHERICSVNLNLMHALSAIEVMDPQADTGLSHVPPRDFDLSRRLRPEEVLALIDRVFQAEMLWHDGYDLSQTIFTCLYALHLDQQSLWAASPSSAHEQEQDTDADPKLTSLVLYAYLLAVCKGIDLTMQEYARGNVLEQDDVSTHKNGQPIAEEMPVEAAAQQLDDALDWLLPLAQSSQDPFLASLLGRLQMRTAYLVALALTIDGTLGDREKLKHVRTHTDAARMFLDDMSTHSYLDSSSPAVEAAFDPLVARLLPQPNPHPLRQMPKPNWQDSCEKMKLLLDGFDQAIVVSNLEGWVQWSRYYKHYARKDRPPLARSLMYSVLYSEPLKALALRVEYSLAMFAQSFVFEFAGIEEQFIQEWRHLDTSAIDFWLAKLAGQLCNVCFLLTENRPRQQRKLPEALPEWRLLVSHLERLPDHSVKPAIADACRYVMADLAIESYLAGFQLDLYDCPAEESAIVIWAIHQLSTFQMKWLSARLGGSPASPVNDDLEVSASQRPSWIDREHSTCKIIHEFSYNDMLLCWWYGQTNQASDSKSLKEQHVYFRIRLRDLAKLVLPGVRLDWATYVEQRSSFQHSCHSAEKDPEWLPRIESSFDEWAEQTQEEASSVSEVLIESLKGLMGKAPEAPPDEAFSAKDDMAVKLYGLGRAMLEGTRAGSKAALDSIR